MFTKIACLILAHLSFLAPVDSIAQKQEEPPRPRQPINNGPWNNDLLVYRVSKSDPAKQIGRFERAGVPTLARMADGRLVAAFQYFPKDDEKGFDRIAVSFSSDEGSTWTPPKTIVVNGLPRGMMRPFDPTLVTLSDGKIRMYFTGNYSGRFVESTPTICSAISEDAINFDFEEGVRFAIENKICIDCAVALHGDTFHLFVPDNTKMESELNRGNERDQRERQPNKQRADDRNGYAYYATSKDGLSFERQDDLRINSETVWLGNAVSSDEKLYFFGTGHPRPTQQNERRNLPSIWFASSSDGREWKSLEYLDSNGADPAAVRLKGGDWLIIATSQPVRNETPPFRGPGTKNSKKR